MKKNPIFNSFNGVLRFVVTLALLSQHQGVALADSGWEPMGNEDGIQAWRKEVPGSSLVAFRGEATIDASISKVAGVLFDTSKKTQWVHNCVSARNVREISDFDRVEYNHTSSGVFVVSDRDFVFNAKVQADPAKNLVVFKLKSVEDPLAPEAGPTRGEMKMGLYTLQGLAPNKTKVTVEIHADPKGILPAFLVNLFQKAWPTRTLRGIRTQAMKPDVQEYTKLREILEGKVANTIPITGNVVATPSAKGESLPTTTPSSGASPSTVQASSTPSNPQVEQSPSVAPTEH
jgi:hypothetical protein